MKHAFLMTFLLLLAKINNGQSVEIISKSNFKPESKIKSTAFIHDTTDLNLFQFVASYRAIGDDSTTTFGDLYDEIKNQAIKLGANCFKLNKLFLGDKNRPCLFIDTYNGSEAVMTINNMNYGNNLVFVFCPENINHSTFTLKINDTTRTFNTSTYLKLELRENEELKLTKGGFTGAKAKLKYKKAKPPVYLMVTGFSPGGGPLPTPGTIAVSFNTGRIIELSDDYGQFLAKILKQSD